MAYSLNSAGPHQRDIDRLEKAFEKAVAKLGNHFDGDFYAHTAQTGTVYVTITVTAYDGDCTVGDSRGIMIADETGEFVRKYRFAAHPECYDSHDYSVHSGGTAARNRAAGTLEPGYDGYATQAISDMRQWVSALA
jgi:hypothetical protein